MAIHVYWEDDARRLIRWDCGQIVEEADFDAASAQTHAMLDEVDYPVDIITDARHTRSLFSNFLPHGRRMAMAAHPNRGLGVLVTSNLLMKSLFEVFTKVYGRPGSFAMATSLEEARVIIQRRHAAAPQSEQR